MYRTLGRFGPPATGRLVFDEQEYDVLEKACAAMFPGPPEWPFKASEVGTAEFVDTYVGGLYEDNQFLFRVLMRTLNVSSVLTHGAAFRWLTENARREVLSAWRESDLRVRRAGYQSMSLMIKMGYYEDDRVRASAGFVAGCDLSGRAKPPGALR